MVFGHTYPDGTGLSKKMVREGISTTKVKGRLPHECKCGYNTNNGSNYKRHVKICRSAKVES
jgi:hypothetical protein